MNDLAFIKDVIYGLKREYGVMGSLHRDTVVTDLATGNKVTTSVINQLIPRILFLPFSWRKFIINKQKGGIQNVGSQEILIDKSDLPINFEIKIGDYIVSKGKRIEIGTFDNYEYAYILHAKTLEGMPLD